MEAITSAKVPIIKLFYQNLKVEADISLYNVLARWVKFKIILPFLLKRKAQLSSR